MIPFLQYWTRDRVGVIPWVLRRSATGVVDRPESPCLPHTQNVPNPSLQFSSWIPKTRGP